MKFVAAALRSDLGHRAVEASVFGIVVVGEDLDAADRILAGSDDRRSAPDGAHCADAVHVEAIILKLVAVGVGRWAVFRGKNAAGVAQISAAARRGSALRSGSLESVAAALVRSVGKCPGRQLNQAGRVTLEDRHVLDLVFRDGLSVIHGFRVQSRNRRGVDRNCLR